MTFAVKVPLVNPNEPEALLAAVHVTSGQHVQPGDLLFTVETTKAAAEVNAEAEGYVTGLRYTPGQTLHAGDIFCYLAESPDWTPPAEPKPAAKAGGADGDLPPGLRITQPALALARQHNLDLSGLPIGPLLTESQVRERLSQAEPGAGPLPSTDFDPTAIIVYGAGGHGKIVLDLLNALGSYRIAGIIDDGRQPGDQVLGVPVLGGSGQLADLYSQGVRLGVNAVGGIGNIGVRIKVFQKLGQAGFACPVLIHPRAYIERNASIAAGAHILAMAYVGSEVRVGYGAIVSTGAIVSHDCRLGDYVNLSPGAILAGDVQVGDRALIGMGVTVNLGVKIGAGARIGNSATVKAHVPEGGVVRAGTIWPE